VPNCSPRHRSFQPYFRALPAGNHHDRTHAFQACSNRQLRDIIFRINCLRGDLNSTKQMAPTFSYAGGRFVSGSSKWHRVAVGAEGTSRITGGALARFGRRSLRWPCIDSWRSRRARARGRPALDRAAIGPFMSVEFRNDVPHGGYRITSHEKRRWGVVLVQSSADLLDRALRARRRSDADHPSRRELSLIGA